MLTTYSKSFLVRIKSGPIAPVSFKLGTNTVLILCEPATLQNQEKQCIIRQKSAFKTEFDFLKNFYVFVAVLKFKSFNKNKKLWKKSEKESSEAFQARLGWLSVPHGMVSAIYAAFPSISTTLAHRGSFSNAPNSTRQWSF